jgi:SAM-dependent methyltransferase
VAPGVNPGTRTSADAPLVHPRREGHAGPVTGEASWLDSMPEVYDRCLGPALFTPPARHLAATAAGLAPSAVLELAAGTGILTAELVRALPTADVTATDLNPGMVSWGARTVPAATWLVADAQTLEFADGSFDLVACQFGVMFFPDKPAAFAEVARVLRPGGNLLFDVWDTVDATTVTTALTGALADVLPDQTPDFVTRIPHGYHDPGRIRADVEAGGLVVDALERVVLRGTGASAGAVAEGFCRGTPLRFALEQRGDLDTLTAAVAERMTTRVGTGPVEGDLAAIVVSAHRP